MKTDWDNNHRLPKHIGHIDERKYCICFNYRILYQVFFKKQDIYISCYTYSLIYSKNSVFSKVFSYCIKKTECNKTVRKLRSKHYYKHIC